MLAPALMSTRLRHQVTRSQFSRILASPLVSRSLGALAVLELLLDKTSLIPARVEPPALLGRMLSGAIVGLSSARERRLSLLPRAKITRPRLLALAAVGAGAALVATFAAYHGRRAMSERFGLSSAVAGALEDGLALAVVAGLQRVSR